VRDAPALRGVPEVVAVDFQYKGKAVKVLLDDITRVKVDAVVNAANEGLRGGGGVDGAIHRAGGPAIMQECRKIGRCPTGQAVLTTGGNLPAKHVIHTVGPIWYGGKNGEADFLRLAYENSLSLAREQGLTSIAFPSISTGVYGFPIEEAAPIAIKTVLRHLDGPTSIEEVQFVLFSQGDLDLYLKTMTEILGN
jgi:O-acetyl-ADP-ribose deacetylase (regulator of RNase III)